MHEKPPLPLGPAVPGLTACVAGTGGFGCRALCAGRMREPV